MYSLHDIEVNGLDLAEVLECEIESRAGDPCPCDRRRVCI